jgi:hypothetical protein
LGSRADRVPNHARIPICPNPILVADGREVPSALAIKRRLGVLVWPHTRERSLVRAQARPSIYLTNAPPGSAPHQCDSWGGEYPVGGSLKGRERSVGSGGRAPCSMITGIC